MDNQNKSKSKDYQTPLPIRRRLSVPETIMRRHTLGSQKVDWNSSTSSQPVEPMNQWYSGSGSDPNLVKKTFNDCLRRSTLLRRMWAESNPTSNYSARLTQSRSKYRSSTNSSPDRNRNSIRFSRFQQSDSPSPSRWSSTTFPTSTTLDTDLKSTSYDSSSTIANSKQYLLDHNENSYLAESATQTFLTKNIDVISNVELSEATLSTIYNKVMQDATSSKNGQSSRIIHVQQIPTFQPTSTKPDNNCGRIMKYVISNVDAGSSYYKAEKKPQVSRYSALPRTDSMEVNTSEDNISVDDSDENSLVDSLEDPTSPRCSLSSILPDNSAGYKKFPKSSAFFIPIQGAEYLDVKSVAEHMPKAVKDRLNNRQMELEEKLRQMKSSTHIVLPEIVDRSRRSKCFQAKKKKKKGKDKDKSKLVPKNEQKPKSSASSKHTAEKGTNWKRSRIPIPLRPKLSLPAITENKPTFLNFEQTYKSEPKVDQLIANILIDALNRPEGDQVSSASYTKKEQQESRRKPRFSKGSLPYKGKVALEVIRDDNFSTIPKGWITFYTLTKSQESSESSSDEGLRKDNKSMVQDDNVNAKQESKAAEDMENNEIISCVNVYQDQNGNSGESNNTESRPQSQTNYAIPAGWSITVNGNCAPEIELRLSFPRKTKEKGVNSHSDSGVGEDQVVNKNKRLPSIVTLQNDCSNCKYKQGVDLHNYHGLPKIILEKSRTEKSSRKKGQGRNKLYGGEPPKLVDYSSDSTFPDILNKFPDILAVSGSTISPERKPRFLTMSERDLTRHYS